MTKARVMQVATSLNSALANYDNKTVTATKYYNKTESDSFNTYSTEEIDTCKTWIDGKKIYRKVLLNTSDVQLSYGDAWATIAGWSNLPSGFSELTYFAMSHNYSNRTDFFISGGIIKFCSLNSYFTISRNSKLIIEYTKTTD